ncbi:MAG: ABC transporter ATP-binding protein [Halobacteriota archaeon]
MKKDTRIRNKVKMNDFNHSTSQQLNNLASQQLNNSTSDGVAIRVDHVSKKYCKSLKRSMLYGVKDIGRNTLGLSSHSDKLRKSEFWAVDDVSFEVKKGETLGIIGPNGSGKTTLLKMLNGIFWPDKGKISIRGRVGALIEVGAGFHPLLTGRENVYINAAILGMTKEEVDEKFDDIIKFADIGDFLDTPVKFYSSGMFVRLGFAVAVHCEPDILLVDEVLAVGDVEFRAKCYNKIAELMENCAVVIVSHDMPSIARISSKCMVLNNGHSIFHGTAEEAIQRYLSIFEKQKTNIHSDGVRLVNCDINAKMEKGDYILTTGKPLEINLELDSEVDVEPMTLMLCFNSSSGEMVAEWNSFFNGNCLKLHKGYQKFHISLDSLRLNPGTYLISLIVTSKNQMEHLLWVHYGWTFRINGEQVGNAPYEIDGSISSSDGHR